MHLYKSASVSDLIGKTLISVNGAEKDNDEIIFECSDGNKYKMYHEQECCEGVWIEDICGNIDDLIGSPLTMAEDASNELANATGLNSDWDYSYTWTFYKFATINGYVTIRWYGESNGYYSEDVDFVRIMDTEEK